MNFDYRFSYVLYVYVAIIEIKFTSLSGSIKWWITLYYMVLISYFLYVYYMLSKISSRFQIRIIWKDSDRKNPSFFIFLITYLHYARVNNFHPKTRSLWSSVHIPTKYNIIRVQYKDCTHTHTCRLRKYVHPTLSIKNLTPNWTFNLTNSPRRQNVIYTQIPT